MVPCQNTGTESPSRAPTRVMLSRAPSRRTADTTPAGIPSASAKTTASDGQLERHRQALEDESDHGLARAPGGAEVALEEPAEPARVLHVPRLVEPEEAP